MTWDVTIKEHDLIEVRLDYFRCDLAREFIADYGAKAFVIALERVPDDAFFMYGERAELAGAMHEHYITLVEGEKETQ